MCHSCMSDTDSLTIPPVGVSPGASHNMTKATVALTRQPPLRSSAPDGRGQSQPPWTPPCLSTMTRSGPYFRPLSFNRSPAAFRILPVPGSGHKKSACRRHRSEGRGATRMINSYLRPNLLQSTANIKAGIAAIN